MDNYTCLLRDVLQYAGEIYFRRVEAELQKFADALRHWLHEFFERPRPDWREGLDHLLAQQQAEGRVPTSESRQALLAFLEDWAKTVDWSALESRTETARSSQENEQSQRDIQPGLPFSHTDIPSENIMPFARQAADEQLSATSGRGDQSQFSREAEEIVSNATGIPRNQGPGRQTIPGSGPGGFRIPDFPVRGPAGSVRQRGTIIEVKASRGKSFGTLSSPSRRQIDDAVDFVQRLRSKSSLVKDPAIKELLLNAHVEVFSDLAPPRSGRFSALIEDNILEWKPIPRAGSATGTATRGASTMIPSTARSIGKPGVGAAANIALGIVASLAEAGVADAVYRDAVTVLTDLLKQISRDGVAKEKDWQEIDEKLKDIANMKQSKPGFAWEVITYGQGSLKEKQALELIMLAWDLGKKFGYENKRTWGDVFDGRFGHFGKTQ